MRKFHGGVTVGEHRKRQTNTLFHYLVLFVKKWIKPFIDCINELLSEI